MTTLADLQATQAAAIAMQGMVASAVSEMQAVASGLAPLAAKDSELQAAIEKINTLAIDLQLAVAKAFPPAPTK